MTNYNEIIVNFQIWNLIIWFSNIKITLRLFKNWFLRREYFDIWFNLKNGFIIDGTGNPGFYGDIAIKDNLIAK